MSSSSKRRKLEQGQGQDTPKSDISALTARRRLAAAAAAAAAAACERSPSPTEDEPQQRTANAFSVLQTLRQGDEAATRYPHALKSASTRNISATKGGTDKTIATPEKGVSIQKAVLYSSFRLDKSNHRRNQNGVTELRLRDCERFIVLGSFGIRVRLGEAVILGATLSPSEQIHWIHAPHCQALPIIRTSQKTHLDLHNDKARQPLSSLAALSPLYQRIWNEDDDGNTLYSPGTVIDSYKILFTPEDAPKKGVIQELNSPPEWNKAISDILDSIKADGRTPFSALVCGPKSSGKSTFSKLLTNRCVTSQGNGTAGQTGRGIALIDLDPGQPEYAPAGTLSLVHVTAPNLGTSFSHPGVWQAGYTVVRCHALASVTPASSPSLYIDCAMDLLETYRRSLRNCPLIINTAGWILGTGLDLLVELVTKMMPTQVLYMSEDGPVDVVDALRAATKRLFLTLPSQPSEYTMRTAAHLRAMQAMSYFHVAEEAQAKAPETLSWNPQPITAMPPWQVGYAFPKSGIRGVLSYEYQSLPELLAAAMNGMVMAVVEVEDEEAFRGIVTGYKNGPQRMGVIMAPESAPAQGDAAAAMNDLKMISSPEGLPIISNPNDATLDPRYSRTVGLALVRGIDVAAKKLQLITPIPGSEIQGVGSRGHDVVLVHGKFDAPTWAYAEDFFSQRAATNASCTWREVERGEKETAEMGYEETSEDESDSGQQQAHVAAAAAVADVQAVPWLEVLHGHQKRPVGSRVWHVRRDLGRSTGD